MLKVNLVYPYIAGKFDKTDIDPTDFNEIQAKTDRFVSTFNKFDPGYPVELVVACNNGPLTRDVVRRFDSIKQPLRFDTYVGGGWDIGCHLYMATRVDCDVVIFSTSRFYFWKSGWLKKLIDARLKFGDGLYGPMASYEHWGCQNDSGDAYPHIRSGFFCCNPKILMKYPHVIDSRKKSYYFESGIWSYTDWFERRGMPCKMVTWDGVYDKPQWRTPDNIFRRGDQSNCLVLDKHTDHFRDSNEGNKKILEARANGYPIRGCNQKYHFP